jgi:hypothetical protein
MLLWVNDFVMKPLDFVMERLFRVMRMFAHNGLPSSSCSFSL